MCRIPEFCFGVPHSLNWVKSETRKCLSNSQIKLSNKTQTTASTLLSSTVICHSYPLISLTSSTNFGGAKAKKSTGVSMRERRAAGPHTSLRSQAGKDRDAIEATEEWGCSRGVCASDGRDRAPRPPPCGGWGTRRPPLSLHLPSPMTHRVCHFPLRVPRPADDSATTATFGDTFHLQTSGETVRVAVIDPVLFLPGQ